MLALLTLLATAFVVATAVLYERLLSTRAALNRADEECDAAQWRALVAEDKAGLLEANLGDARKFNTGLADTTKHLAEKEALVRSEVVQLKAEMLRQKLLRDTARQLQPVKVPSDEDLERGRW